MPDTLQDLRARKFATVKAFAEALGVSPSTASAWLRADYDWYPPGDRMHWKMWTLLEVTAPVYQAAQAETRKQQEARKQARKKADRQAGL